MKLLLGAITVAAKYVADYHPSNSMYAKISGISKEDINAVELEFLFGVKFDLEVKPSTMRAFEVGTSEGIENLK